MSQKELASLEQGSELAKRLFRGELSASEIRAMPAQTLYVAILSAGRELLPDVLPYVSREQYRLLLDFDFWEKDSFLPKQALRWLIALQSESSLELQQQFLAALPADVLELLTQHLVEVQVYEEATDNPPGLGWFTPDGGSLWLRFLAEDEFELRALGQAYALLFQRSPELFYQLMLNLHATTSLELEESSLGERERRLLDAGIPNIDAQIHLQCPLTLSHAIMTLKRYEDPNGRDQSTLFSAERELREHSTELEPLTSFLRALSDGDRNVFDQVLAELARILNAGMLIYRTSLEEGSEVRLFQEQVRGLINIGLERIGASGRYQATQVYAALGLQGLYRLGLGELLPLRTAILNVPEERWEDAEDIEAQEALQRNLPLYPISWVEALIPHQSPRAFYHLDEIAATLERIIELQE